MLPVWLASECVKETPEPHRFSPALWLRADVARGHPVLMRLALAGHLDMSGAGPAEMLGAMTVLVNGYRWQATPDLSQAWRDVVMACLGGWDEDAVDRFAASASSIASGSHPPGFYASEVEALACAAVSAVRAHRHLSAPRSVAPAPSVRSLLLRGSRADIMNT